MWIRIQIYTSRQTRVQNPGGKGQYPGGKGQYPGGKGQYPGGKGQYPGGKGQYPGGKGQYHVHFNIDLFFADASHQGS